VELLVVAGVSMILIALALPMLSSSRAAARRNGCLRQLSSHAVVLQAYANDNSGYWPYALEHARQTPPIPDDISNDATLSQMWYGIVGGLWHMAVLDAYNENPIHESLICPADTEMLLELELLAAQSGVDVRRIGGTTSTYILSTAMFLDPVALDPAAPAWEERFFRGTRLDEVVFPSAKASLHEIQPYHDTGYVPGTGPRPIPAMYNVLAADSSAESRRSDTFMDAVIMFPFDNDRAREQQLEASKLDLTPHGVRGRDW